MIEAEGWKEDLISQQWFTPIYSKARYFTHHTAYILIFSLGSDVAAFILSD